MSSFSERFGYTTPLRELSEEEMPEALANGLWDVIYEEFCQPAAQFGIIGQVEGYIPLFEFYSRFFWTHVLKSSIDTHPENPIEARKLIRRYFFDAPFNKKYDLLELSASIVPDPEKFAEKANFFFERERAAFRFAGEEIIRISAPEELEEITSTITEHPSSAVRTHIRTAAKMYSDREAPDYRNSIKESISAVEAAVCYVSGEKPSGVSKNLKKTLDENILHPALRQGFEKIFAFTSDESGIRHALLEDGRNVSQADARFMLIACSAFANYLIGLKTGIL